MSPQDNRPYVSVEEQPVTEITKIVPPESALPENPVAGEEAPVTTRAGGLSA